MSEHMPDCRHPNAPVDVCGCNAKILQAEVNDLLAYKAVSIAPPYGNGDWQLYNVVDDPGETLDIAKAQPEVLKNYKPPGTHTPGMLVWYCPNKYWRK